jgi:D-alanyl-lipoteichoic acid acyltransferase DltB (MBOAT superfamily)
VYVPLGGSRKGLVRQLAATCVCFAFVAVWHDLEDRLFAWAFGLCVIIAPELLVRRRRMITRDDRPPSLFMQAMLAIGGGLNICMLQLVNLVGYAVGVEGGKDLLTSLLESRQGAQFALWWVWWMVVGAGCMVAQRSMEAH